MAVTHDFSAVRREALTAFPEYFNMLFAQWMPQLSLALNSANVAGQGLGQDVSSAMGRLGASSSGLGALTRGMANTYASQFQSQARMAFLQNTMQNALSMLAGNLQAGQGGKQAPWWQGMLQNLPGAAASFGAAAL